MLGNRGLGDLARCLIGLSTASLVQLKMGHQCKTHNYLGGPLMVIRDEA